MPFPGPDLSSIAGQFHARRALEVAACGGHNLALIGGPGAGKTLLARALLGLLPPYSQRLCRPVVEGQQAMTWVEEALCGRPGLLEQARHGVLWLERLDCFGYSPLQIQRVATVFDQVPDVQLILTLQPCPCGRSGDPALECLCPASWIKRHRQRLSALLERMAMTIEIPRLDYEHHTETRPPEASASVAARVREGDQRQRKRFGDDLTLRNAAMDHAQILRWCELDVPAQKLYKAAYQQLHFSSRTADGVLTVARTIADLAGADRMQANHLAEAIQYQPRF
jgi:magnesium chelatase family protein